MMGMTPEQFRRAVGMWGLAMCLLASAAGWVFMKFGQAWSVADLPISNMVGFIVPAYAVTEVAMIPVGGKMIDRYGCRSVLSIAPFIFIIASMLCMVSVSVTMLVILRVVQGIGAGLILALAFSCVGKYYDSDKRGKCNELMTGAFAIGSLFSSCAGYFLSENINWRMGFIALSALMLLGFLLAWRFLPKDEGTGIKFDTVNLVITAAAFGCVTLYLQTVNEVFEPDSPASLILGASSLVLIALMFITAYRSDNPCIPVRISNFEKLLFLLMFVFSVCGLGLIQYFFKLYLVFYEFDIFKASFNFLFLLIGGACTSMIGLRFVYKTGCRPWVVFGAIMVTIALVVTHFYADKGVEYFALSLFLFGLGLGSIVTEIICSVQTVVRKEDMGLHVGTLMGMRMVAILTGNVIIGSYINMVIRGSMPPSIIDLSATDDILKTLGDFVSDSLHYLSVSMDDGFLTTTIILAMITAGLAVVSHFIRKDDVIEMQRLKAEEDAGTEE